MILRVIFILISILITYAQAMDSPSYANKELGNYNFNDHLKERKKLEIPSIWHSAAIGNEKALCSWLQQKGVKILNLQDEKANTPLIWAATKGKVNTIRLMLEVYSEIDVNAKDAIKGRTAIQWAIRMHNGSVSKGGETLSNDTVVEIIKLLVQHNANITIPDQEGRTAKYWINKLNLTQYNREQLLNTLEGIL